MTTRKTDLDIRREEFARKLDARLLEDSKIGVIAGGRSGPYTVVVRYLNKKELLALLERLRTMRECLFDP